MTDLERQQKLFEATMKQIRNRWKNRTSLQQFVAIAQAELRYIRYYYMMETAEHTAVMIVDHLNEAAQNLQLSITTKLESIRFGIQISVLHQGAHYGEIFIGPRDAWDKIMYLPHTGQYWYNIPGKSLHQEATAVVEKCERFRFLYLHAGHQTSN